MFTRISLTRMSPPGRPGLQGVCMGILQLCPKSGAAAIRWATGSVYRPL